MRILQTESKVYYNIEDQGAQVTVFDSKSNKTFVHKATYDAVWHLIELIRQSLMDSVDDEVLTHLEKHFRFGAPLTKSILPMIRREKINRMYYEQVFLRILTQLRSGAREMELTASSFSIHHELVHLIKKHLGTKLTLNPLAV